MKSTLLLVPAALLLAVDPGHARNGDHVPRTEGLDIEMFYQFSATDEDAEVTIGIESPDNPIESLVIVTPGVTRLQQCDPGMSWALRKSSWKVPSPRWRKSRPPIRRGFTGSGAGR